MAELFGDRWPVGPARLNAIKARTAAASPRPWWHGDDGLVWAARPGDPVCGANDPADAVFIANARSDIEDLTAEVERLRALLGDDVPTHVIDLREDGWTLKHPLSCRPNLFDCPVNRAAGADDRVDSDGLRGRFECGIDDDTGEFFIGAAVCPVCGQALPREVAPGQDPRCTTCWQDNTLDGA